MRTRHLGTVSVAVLACAFGLVPAGEPAGGGAPPSEGPPPATPPAPEPKGPPTPEAAPPETAPAKPSGDALPRGVIARVNGRDVTVEEYASYLLASVGKTRLDEYVNRLLLDEKARGLGIRIEQNDVEGAVQETLDRTIKSQYQGDRDAYVQALARRNRTPEEEASRLRQELYYDMVERRIILESRKVTEADVAARFEELYGEGGVEYVLRHILVSTRPRLAASGTGATSGRDEVERRTPREARDRAEEARKAILGGMSFAEAVQKYSDDPATRRTDGRIPRYRARLFGERFHSVVQKLTPERPLGEVVESPRGYHVVELVEKRATKIEDVRAEISKWLEGSPPSVRERQQLLRDLRAQAKIEGLP